MGARPAPAAVSSGSGDGVQTSVQPASHLSVPNLESRTAPGGEDRTFVNVAEPPLQHALDRKNLAFVAIQRARMPMVLTDPRQPDNPIVLANQAFLNETGYALHEVIGRNCRFLQGPMSDPQSVVRVRDALRNEREITVEFVNYRKDGSQFWNQLYISPIHDDSGKLLHFFASQLDTTRRHRARELEVAERNLLMEVDHRAKNALALVQGIVRLTRRDEASRFADAVQGRVDALARAHAILSEHRWRNVSVERIVRSEVERFDMKQVRISGEHAELSAAQVQPIALLLHELAANARRHGGLSVAMGRLSVDWQVDPGRHELRLRWTERGGPLPPSERSPGYGQTMIDAIVNRQLRGRVDYAWDDGGVVVHVTIPKERLEA